MSECISQALFLCWYQSQQHAQEIISFLSLQDKRGQAPRWCKWVLPTDSKRKFVPGTGGMTESWYEITLTLTKDSSAWSFSYRFWCSLQRVAVCDMWLPLALATFEILHWYVPEESNALLKQTTCSTMCISNGKHTRKWWAVTAKLWSSFTLRSCTNSAVLILEAILTVQKSQNVSLGNSFFVGMGRG